MQQPAANASSLANPNPSIAEQEIRVLESYNNFNVSEIGRLPWKKQNFSIPKSIESFFAASRRFPSPTI
jgi:hypothetical protein